VNKTEFGPGVADVRVTIQRVGDTVGSPSSVSHRGLAEEDLLHVDLDNISVLVAARLGGERGRESLGNVFAEGSDLADFLEEDEGRVGRVSVDSNTC
jgi:hypothetical protein